LFPGGSAYVIHMAGFDMTPHAYAQDMFRGTPPFPQGATFQDTGQDFPVERAGKSAFYLPSGSDRGFIFSTNSGNGNMWRWTVHQDGSLESANAMQSPPGGSGNGRGDVFIARNTLFIVRGSQVFRSKLQGNGDMGAWEAMPGLSEEQIDIIWGDGHNEGQAYGIIGNFVYLAGQRKVHYAQIVPSP
jgi:hypothetical protein